MTLRPLRSLCVALALVLALPGCALPPAVIPPVAPPAMPTAHVVTEPEFEAVGLGTPEGDLVARFGPALRVVRLPAEGVEVYLYRATTAADPTRFAEFWIRDGRVVNRLIY